MIMISKQTPFEQNVILLFFYPQQTILIVL